MGVLQEGAINLIDEITLKVIRQLKLHSDLSNPASMWLLVWYIPPIEIAGQANLLAKRWLYLFPSIRCDSRPLKERTAAIRACLTYPSQARHSYVVKGD